MKKYIIAILAVSLISFNSCKKEDTEPATEETAMESAEYHAHIHSPHTDDKHIDDSIHLHIEFESHSGMTVHHVKVRIYNLEDGTEVYNAPEDAHVMETSGLFEWHDDFVLSNANGIEAHTDWIVEAKVWGHEAGTEEVIETLQFHVHP